MLGNRPVLRGFYENMQCYKIRFLVLYIYTHGQNTFAKDTVSNLKKLVYVGVQINILNKI